jgi:hypothetical protein
MNEFLALKAIVRGIRDGRLTAADCRRDGRVLTGGGESRRECCPLIAWTAGTE